MTQERKDGHDSSEVPDRGSKRALVIDDEELVTTIVRICLQREGFEVLLASSGSEGLSIFAAELPRLDVVLVDMSMPGLSGLEVIARIRAESSEIPIVLMSGLVPDALEDPSVTFLQKPFRPDDLLRILDSALDGSDPNRTKI